MRAREHGPEQGVSPGNRNGNGNCNGNGNGNGNCSRRRRHHGSSSLTDYYRWIVFVRPPIYQKRKKGVQEKTGKGGDIGSR